jgi:hypothetical protein
MADATHCGGSPSCEETEDDVDPFACGSLSRRALLSTLALFPAIGSLRPLSAWAQAQPDPLPSWNDGPTKSSITNFVARVATQGSPDFVPTDQRVAPFDNDGTLWLEQPMYVQFAFAYDRVKALAPQNPTWPTTQPFKAVLDGDMAALSASGEKGLMELMAATHAGMTSDEFTKIVADWLSTARDRRFNLHRVRRRHRFVRPWAERVYGIPPNRWWAPRSRRGSR